MQLDLSKFGEYLQIKEKTPQPKILSEEELFIEAISLFEEIWANSIKTYELCGINLLEYESTYHRIIENTFLIKYGTWKTEIIFWYIFGRVNENNEIYPLLVQYVDTEREIYLQNAKELWDFFKEIDEQEENKNE